MFNPLNFIKRKEEQKPKKHSILDIILTDPEWESRLGVQDYTAHPGDFLIDIHNFSVDVEPIVKLQGMVSGLQIKPPTKEYQSLSYEGFLMVNEDFPLYFHKIGAQPRDGHDLKLEQLILNAGRDSPIVMVGRFCSFKHLPNKPYKLHPYVLQFGKYISPVPANLRLQEELGSI